MPLFLLSLLLLAGLPSFGQSPSLGQSMIFRDTLYGLAFDSLEHNLGEVRDGIRRSVKYLKNVSDEPIIIYSAWTTDPHFICAYPKHPIMPNGIDSFYICWAERRGAVNKQMGFFISSKPYLCLHFKQGRQGLFSFIDQQERKITLHFRGVFLALPPASAED